MTTKKMLPTAGFITAVQSIIELVQQIKNPDRIGFTAMIPDIQESRYTLRPDGSYQTSRHIANPNINKFLVTFADDTYKVLKSQLDLPSGKFKDFRIDDDCVFLQFTQGSINIRADIRRFPRKQIKSVELLRGASKLSNRSN